MNTREGNLASYLRQFLRAELDQLAYNRFFRGTVTSVTVQSSGTVLVAITRPGESGSDGNAYVCATPGYRPMVGDDVECVWRDRRRGYVLWPLNASGGLSAKGLVPGGYAKVVGSQGPTAPPFDITGLSRTVTLYSGRTYRITGQTLITSSVASDGTQLAIVEDGNDVELANESVPSAGASGSNRSSVIRQVPKDVSAGSHTYKLSARRNGGGTGTFTNNAAASFSSFITVEDFGPVW